MSRCVVCEGECVEQFLDLGLTALANKFLTGDELAGPEPTFPLRIGFCHDCAHVQLMEHVPPSAMFTDYLYLSSASRTLAGHLLELSDVVMQRRGLRAADLVIDIGCNDGTLLDAFRRYGVRTLGVDPAENLAQRAGASGPERYVGFFTSVTAREIVARWSQACVITATNTFPHIPQLRDFIEGIKTALAPDGVFVIEAHYLVDMLKQVAFDTIYHEHVSYWALGPMVRLFEQAGLQVVDAERLPVHHGQLRVFVQHQGRGQASPSVRAILEAERAQGLDRFETFQRFASRTLELKASLQERLEALRAQGKRVAGYGAPAKGNTLLSFLELDSRSIEYIADRSPLKQGRYTPGRHIPVVAPERLLEDQPDYVLLLAWNFLDEILEQQAAYRQRGGRFIVPVPEVTVV